MGKSLMNHGDIPKWARDQYETMERDRDRWLAIAEAQALEIKRLEGERTRSAGVPLQGIIR